MNSHPDKSGNHSPPQPTPAQERIEETLRTLQETLRHLQDSGSLQDCSQPSSRNRDSSSRGYRTVAPAGPTPSTSQGLSSSSSTSKQPSDGEQSYHRQQAKRRLAEISGKLAEAEYRLGRLTRELNARRDLERRAQAAREEVTRLRGIRMEYGEHGFQDQVRGTSRPAHPGPQSQPKLHGTGRLSPVQAPRRNFHQVHSQNPHCGADRSGNKTGIWKAKKGIDWTSVVIHVLLYYCVCVCMLLCFQCLLSLSVHVVPSRIDVWKLLHIPLAGILAVVVVGIAKCSVGIVHACPIRTVPPCPRLSG